MVRTTASRAGPQVPGAWRALAELGNGAAIAQGLRTALVCFASFAIGQWALGQLEIAVFATFTGLALCGIADFGGTLTGRFRANAAAATAGLALVALGTWASSQALWLSTAMTFAIGAIVVLSGLFGATPRRARARSFFSTWWLPVLQRRRTPFRAVWRVSRSAACSRPLPRCPSGPPLQG